MQIREGLRSLETHNVTVEYLQTPERPAAWIKYNILLSNAWYLLFCVTRVCRYADVLAIDYGGRLHTLLFALVIRLMGRIHLAIFVQSLNFAYRPSRLRNLLDKQVSRVFLRLGDIVITSGQAVSMEVAQLGVCRERIRTIYPALRDEFRRCFSPVEARNGHEGLIVLWVGRVHPIKGLEYLIEAMASLKTGLDVRLVLVGDESLVPSYTQRIVELIKKTGLQQQVDRRGRIDCVDALATIYSKADIFVLPSVWDTSPIAVIEAMSFGLPIITTTAGGAGEWVEDGVNGFLVPPADVGGLRNAIGRLIRERNLRERMGRASLGRSVGYCDRTWKDVGREYYETFLPLLKQQTGPITLPASPNQLSR
jgi:glycosyltransferase involved in cell wall biosynthesis